MSVAEVKKAIAAASVDPQYNEATKRILSNKIILAHILSQTVKEFRGVPPEEIVPLIEGKPYMEEEYNITLEDKIGKDVKNMCDLSQYVKEEGIEIGKEIGMKRGIARERERSEKLLAEKDEAIAEKDAIIESLKRRLAAFL